MVKFDDFWRVYPRRVAKGAGQKAWDKLKPDEDLFKQITLALEAQARYRAEAKNKGEFLPDWPHPSTWLNQQRWLDEIGSHAELKEKAHQAECAVDGCSFPVHAPKSGNPFCIDHFSMDENGRMRDNCRLVPELRRHYEKHPEIHGLRGRDVLKFMKETIRGMIK